MKRKSWLALTLSITMAAVLIGAMSCGVATALEETLPVVVRAVVVKEVLVPDLVSGYGSLAFIRKVDVAAPQDAVIDRLACREGDVIKAGTLIARLRNPQLELAVGRAENMVLQAESACTLAQTRVYEGKLATEAKLLDIEKTRLEILQARRELAEAERKHSDQATLHRAGGVTEEAIRSSRFSIQSAVERITLMEMDIDIRLVGLRAQDLESRGIPVPEEAAERNRAIAELSVAALAAESTAAKARLEAARKELESARLAVAEMQIVAPLSGVIAARYLETGERVKREEKIFTIIDVESLYAVASFSEPEALRVSTGMEARVTVDGANSAEAPAEFHGVVELVSPVADAGSASFSVRVIIRDPDRRLKPGMFARITITAGASQRVSVVPESSIVERYGQAGTLGFISAGRIAMKRVSFGPSMEAGLVILSGAVPGDVIVDKPDHALKEGQHVTISD